MKKKCIKCGKIKKCRVNKKSKNGIQNICESCNREQYRIYYEENGDYKRQYQRLYSIDPKEAHEFAEHHKLYKKIYRELVLGKMRINVSKNKIDKLKSLFY